MKKKLLIGICILLVIVCLVPRCEHYEDGGTVAYKAILYQVKHVHSIGADVPSGGEYLEGTIVKILGIEVYNDVEAAEATQEIVEEDSIPTDSEPPYEEPISGAPPAEEFRTAQEVVEHIKAVKAAGVEETVSSNHVVLYDKEYIYVLKESPLPGYKQEAVMLITEGINILYFTNGYEDQARFTWYKGYENDERIEKLTERYSLKQYKDTKFFFGELNDNRVIYWWENGNQFSFHYPSESFINHVDIIDHLVVEKYDVA